MSWKYVQGVGGGATRTRSVWKDPLIIICASQERNFARCVVYNNSSFCFILTGTSAEERMADTFPGLYAACFSKDEPEKRLIDDDMMYPAARRRQ